MSGVQLPVDVTERGIQVVENLLRAWASNTLAEDGCGAPMSDDISPENQLAELRRCVDEFRPQIESNQWLQTLLTSL